MKGYCCRVTSERISVDPQIMAGVPCIAGTRIPVTTVVGMVAEGMTIAEIIEDFPQLQPDDVQAALRYASAVLDERLIPLRPSA